jgi:hypothetical protein
MTTLAEDTPIKHELGDYNSIGIIASDTVYEGAMVGDNASGYGRPLVAGDKFKGHARRQVANETGAAGDKQIELLSGRYKLEVTLPGVAITDFGRKVYASDDATLTLVPTSNTLVGKVFRYVGSNTAVVEFDTGDVQDGAELIYSNVADSTAIGASSTAEADFDKNVTIDGTRLKVGDVIRVKGQVKHTGSNTAHTLTVKLKLGTEEICSSGALTIGAQNDLVMIDFNIHVRVIGATGKIAGAGTSISLLNATHAIIVLNKAEATEDISGDTVLKFTGTYGTSDANNTAELENISVEVLHAA